MRTMINWFAIPCSDFERAVKFYSTIFDIEMPRDKDPAGNDIAFFFDPSEGLSGAINSDPNLVPDSTKGPRIYLNAEGTLDQVVERVQSAGGKVLMPRTPVGDYGFISLIHDSEDNLIGLHSRA